MAKKRRADAVEVDVRCEASDGVAAVVRVAIPRALWEAAKTHVAATALVRGYFFRHRAVACHYGDADVSVVVHVAASGRLAMRAIFKVAHRPTPGSTPAEDDAELRLKFFRRKGVTWSLVPKVVASGGGGGVDG